MCFGACMCEYLRGCVCVCAEWGGGGGGMGEVRN